MVEFNTRRIFMGERPALLWRISLSTMPARVGVENAVERGVFVMDAFGVDGGGVEVIMDAMDCVGTSNHAGYA